MEELPVVGQLYKGCYVLREIQPEQGTGKAYTLMSAKCLDRLTFADGEVETVINNGIAQLALSDITGWRLANVDEITYVRAHYSEIESIFNDLINFFCKDARLPNKNSSKHNDEYILTFVQSIFLNLNKLCCKITK